MRIKRFELRQGITKSELLTYGFRFSERLHNSPGFYIERPFKDPITRFEYWIEVWISNNRTDRFNDFDNITVYEDESLQPYFPFYQYFDKEAEEDSVIARVIGNYNDYLSSLPILVELNDNKENKQEGVKHDK